MYKQVCSLDEQETIINFDYSAETVCLYTTKATIMNRILKTSLPFKEILQGGEVCALEITLPLERMGELVRMSILKLR